MEPEVLRSHHPDQTANQNSPEKAVQNRMLSSLASSGQTRLPVILPLRQVFDFDAEFATHAHDAGHFTGD